MGIVPKNTFILKNTAMAMQQTTHPTSPPLALANAFNVNAAKHSMVPRSGKKFDHPNILHPANVHVKSGVVHIITGAAEYIHATTSASTAKDPTHVATMPRVLVASMSGTVDAKNNISPAKTQQTSPTSHNRWDRRSGGSRAQSMKNAAKPIGVFPRTSVEKNCLNASLAILSMGLESEGAAHGETRVLISPGTLVAANIVDYNV